MKASLIFILLSIGSAMVYAQTEEEVYTIVEQMPVFGECEWQDGDEKFLSYRKEVEKCSIRNIEAFLNSEITQIRASFPSGYFNAKVRFIVEVDGSLSNAKLIYSSGHKGIDEACVAIVNKMQNWQAGNQRGKAVRVQYTLTVIFK